MDWQIVLTAQLLESKLVESACIVSPDGMTSGANLFDPFLTKYFLQAPFLPIGKSPKKNEMKRAALFRVQSLTV